MNRADGREGRDMKEAFQQQHEQEEGDMMIGPTGRPMMTPEAMQRKVLRDRMKAEEVRNRCSGQKEDAYLCQKAKLRKERVEKLAVYLQNKLSIFTEAAKGEEDKAVGASFKVSKRSRRGPSLRRIVHRRSADSRQSKRSMQML